MTIWEGLAALMTLQSYLHDNLGQLEVVHGFVIANSKEYMVLPKKSRNIPRIWVYPKPWETHKVSKGRVANVRGWA